MAEPVVQMDAYRVKERIFATLRQRPELRDKLAHMVRVEEAAAVEAAKAARLGTEHYWSGWRCQEVQTPPAVVNALLYEEIVCEVYRSSRSGGCYRLASLEATREALGELVIPETAPRQDRAVDLENLFKYVYGLEDTKAMLRYALAAPPDKRVHCLMISPPGMAKSQMLDEIGLLPGARWFAGSTTSKAGLVDMVLRDRPSILVLDELEEMAPADMSPLLNLMQSGRVTKLIHGRTEDETLELKVFAGCNKTDRLRPAILDRFVRLHIPAYTDTEFVDVAVSVLTHQENLGGHDAAIVAHMVKAYSRSIRDVVSVARLWGGATADKEKLAVIVRSMFGHLARPQAPLPAPTQFRRR